MKHAARIFLLLSATLLLAYYLPIAWHILTATRERGPFVQYSDTGHGFLFTRYDFNPTTRDVTIRYTDTAGRAYERDAFEQMLPLTYYAQLEKNGTMPRQINGVSLTASAIRRAMWSVRLRPDELDAPSVPLLTVFETASGRARLEVPPDYMRIRDDGRIEFLDPKNNSILAPKSALYTEAFASAKFVFPVTALGSNPSPRKPYDEGIYLTDSEGQTFLLRQALGTPILVRIADIAADPAAWRALRPQHIIVNEVETRELRALIIDTDGHPWLATGKDHRLIKLPTTTYSPATASLSLRANLLSRLLIVQSEDKLEAIAFDKNYDVLDRHEETRPAPGQKPASKIAAILFPVSWWLHDNSSSYYNFHGKYGSLVALALNAVFFIIYLYILVRRSRKNAQPLDIPGTTTPSQNAKRRSAGFQPAQSQLMTHIPELAAIALCGLCAFIPALLLPRSE